MSSVSVLGAALGHEDVPAGSRDGDTGAREGKAARKRGAL
jgi:hypothetical protein